MIPARPLSLPRPRIVALALVAVAAFAVALMASAAGLLTRIESDSVDLRFQQRAVRTPPGVAVVAIDDIAAHGQWPWPRTLHARAIDRLTTAGARVIAYDVQFTEPSANQAADLALFDSVRRSGRVVLATTEVGPGGTSNVFGSDDNVRDARATVGAANFVPSAGNIIRRIPYDLEGLPSFAVAVAHRAGVTANPRAFGADGAWIDYAGPPGTVMTVPFDDLLRGRFAPDAFRGKVVVVGVTAPTLHDVHSTPMTDTGLMSGAEVQANAISTVLRGIPLRDAGTPWLLIATAAMSLIAPLIGLRRGARWICATAVAAALIYAGTVWVAFMRGTVAPVFPPLVALAISTAGAATVVYLAAMAERRALTWYSRSLEDAVRARTAELQLSQLEVVQRLAMAAESREANTGEHIARVGTLCESLALQLGVPPDEAHTLGLASALHDVGKIGVPDRVLLKKGKLDAEEWAIMQAHADRGGDLLAGSQSALLVCAEQIARTHHEHWNGGGYPRGLVGEGIPLAGRICAICDVFDALLSRRPYKEPWTLDATLAEIRELAGRQFDPQIVEQFALIAPRLHVELGYAERAGVPLREAA